MLVSVINTPVVAYKNNATNQVIICYYDNNTESPREWGGSIMKMICINQRNYNIGDVIFHYCDEIDEYLEEENDDILYKFNLYKFEHDNIKFSTNKFSCHFDSCQIGVCIVTKETLNNYFGESIPELTEEMVKKIIDNELETYSKYINGEIYLAQFIENENVDDCEYCGGFYSIDDIFDNFNLNKSDFVEIKVEQRDYIYIH